MQKAYSSDLTDAEWQVIKPVFADQRSYAQHSPRQIMNALFYLLKTGCQWRMLPKGFPPWKNESPQVGARLLVRGDLTVTTSAIQ